MIRRLVAALALLGFGVAVSADDLRFRPLHNNWMPGFFDIRYSGESSTRIWHETLEGTGYIETWSAGETVGTNCIVNEDYTVSSISPTPPAGSMGSQALRTAVVSPGTQANVGHVFGAAQAKTFTRFHVVVLAEGLASGDSIALYVALNAGGVDLIWVLYLNDNAGDLRFIADIFHNGSSNTFTYSGVRLNRRYAIDVKWDSTADTWAWRVDGVEKNSGTLTGSAAAWGLQNMQVGMDSALAPGSDVVFDNITIDTADYPPLVAEDFVTSTAYDWNELYQWPVSPGTDEVWSDGTIVEAGNTYDTNADPADVGTPSNWVSQSAKQIIGATNGGALIRHQFTPKLSTVYHHAEFVVDTETIADTTSFTLTVGKESHHDSDPALDIIAWALFYVRSGAARVLLLQLGEEQNYNLTVAAALDTRYVVEIKYDPAAGYFSAWLDGVLKASGVIKTTWATEIGVFVQGSSASSTARNATIYHDQYLVSTTGFPSAISAKLLLLAPSNSKGNMFGLRRSQ